MGNYEYFIIPPNTGRGVALLINIIEVTDESVWTFYNEDFWSYNYRGRYVTILTVKKLFQMIHLQSPYWSWIDIRLLQALINTSASPEAGRTAREV